MGDRYWLDLVCAHCGTLNEEVSYAASCNDTEFICGKCRKVNFITMNFRAVKHRNQQNNTQI